MGLQAVNKETKRMPRDHPHNSDYGETDGSEGEAEASGKVAALVTSCKSKLAQVRTPAYSPSPAPLPPSPENTPPLTHVVQKGRFEPIHVIVRWMAPRSRSRPRDRS